MMKCVVLRSRVSAWINTSHWICLISLFNLMCFVHLSLCMRCVCVWLFSVSATVRLFPSRTHSVCSISLHGECVREWVDMQAHVCIIFEATCGPSFRWNFRISHNLNGQRQTTHFSDYDRCFRFGFSNDSINLDSVTSPVYDNAVAIAIADAIQIFPFKMSLIHRITF